MGKRRQHLRDARLPRSVSCRNQPTVHNHPDPGHSHPVFPGANLAYQALASSLYAYTGGGSPITFEIGGLTGGATTGIQNAGGGGAHNNMPPFIGVALFMKT